MLEEQFDIPTRLVYCSHFFCRQIKIIRYKFILLIALHICISDNTLQIMIISYYMIIKSRLPYRFTRGMA